MIATSRERIDENGKTISSYSMNGGKEKLREMMKVTCSVAHGSVMYRRKEVIELGKYREGILYAEDYDLWLRMMEKHNIDVLPEILYKFRLTTESRSVASSTDDKYYHNLVRRFARERELHGKDSYNDRIACDITAETSEQHRAEMYHLYRGLEYLSSDFRKEARREFWECVKLRPMRPLYWLLTATAVLPLRILNWMRWVWRKAPRDVH